MGLCLCVSVLALWRVVRLMCIVRKADTREEHNRMMHLAKSTGDVNKYAAVATAIAVGVHVPFLSKFCDQFEESLMPGRKATRKCGGGRGVCIGLSVSSCVYLPGTVC
jgi:hypothetical protein